MFKIKVISSIIVFSSLLIFTSIVKNETREVEKKIFNISKIINLKEKDMNETQLDYFYLTSPYMLDKKVEHLDNVKYIPMEYSKIFLSLSSFIDVQNKFVKQEKLND